MPDPASVAPERDPFLRVLWRHRGDRRAVPLLLQTAQREHGWVSRHHLELMAAVMDVPVEDLDQQVAAHADLRTAPAGGHLVQTCDGLGCQQVASDGLQEVLAQELGIEPGQTTADGRVTWRVVPCLGACERAPAMTVDGHVLGPLAAGDAVALLRRARAGNLPAAPPATDLPPLPGRAVRLTGRVRRPGLVRVQPTTTLSDLVERMGGGTADGTAIKAILCGGRLLHSSQVGEPLPPPDAEETAGRTLQILVLDETACVVDLMVLLLSRAASRACGRCTLGRLGTRRMSSLAAAIRRGAGAGGIEDLRTLGQQVIDGARCTNCGKAASTAVDALAAFPGEVRAHAVAGCCAAGTCGGRP
jgi:NADH-quinone oxidoreductase subunit E